MQSKKNDVFILNLQSTLLFLLNQQSKKNDFDS